MELTVEKPTRINKEYLGDLSELAGSYLDMQRSRVANESRLTSMEDQFLLRLGLATEIIKKQEHLSKAGKYIERSVDVAKEKVVTLSKALKKSKVDPEDNEEYKTLKSEYD